VATYSLMHIDHTLRIGLGTNLILDGDCLGGEHGRCTM